MYAHIQGITNLGWKRKNIDIYIRRSIDSGFESSGGGGDAESCRWKIVSFFSSYFFFTHSKLNLSHSFFSSVSFRLLFFCLFFCTLYFRFPPSKYGNKCEPYRAWCWCIALPCIYVLLRAWLEYASKFLPAEIPNEDYLTSVQSTNSKLIPHTFDMPHSIQRFFICLLNLSIKKVYIFPYSSYIYLSTNFHTIIINIIMYYINYFSNEKKSILT